MYSFNNVSILEAVEGGHEPVTQPKNEDLESSHMIDEVSTINHSPVHFFPIII